MITIRNLKKIYNPQKQEPLTALDNINLQFNKEEFVCILGKSGSGKSTLLNIIAGLDKPTEGNVLIDEMDIFEFNDLEMANCRKDKIGFVFQDFQLMDHLTVVENVELGLSMDSIEKKEKRIRSIEVLKRVGLESHLNHKPSELSGGQKQRVSIARALVKDPEIIIADEPTGALDSNTSTSIMNLLKDISQSGKLVIVVTHDYEFKDYATRIVELRDGKLIEDTTKENTLNSTYRTEKEEKKRSFDLNAAFKLSLKRLIEKKWRYFLVSISMIIGICSLSIAFGISNGIDSYIDYANKRIVDNKKLTFVKKDIINSRDFFSIRKNKAVNLIQDEYILNAKTKLENEELDYKVKPIIQSEYKDIYTRPEILHGEIPKDGQKEIAISKNLAEKILKNKDVKSLIGSEISIKFLAVDELNNYPSRWDKHTFKITGITQKTLIGDDYAYIPYETLKNIVRRSRFLGKEEEIPTNKISVYLKDKKEIETVYKAFNKDYEIIRPSDILKDLTKVFKNFNLIVLGAAVLILLISALMIGIILFISVLERQREIGLIISIGGTKNDIKKIFVTEGILLGLMASTLGTLISILMTFAINPIAIKSMNYPIFKPSLITLGISLSIGIVVSLMSSIIPATKASKLSPIELLRRN